MADVLFSVVIACYNQKEFVRETVDSALSQGHQQTEVIAVDDGSQDGTADILSAYGESITLARLTVNGGVAAARNHGASLAKGKYLVFLDGDDALMPRALQVYHRLIEARHPKIIFGRSAKCDGKIPEDRAISPVQNIQFVEYDDFLVKDRPCLFNTSTFVVDRAAFWAAGGWSSFIFYQDIQDLLTKLAGSGKMILVLAPHTVWYRMHSANASSKIGSFVEGIYVLLRKAQAGLYPGGRGRWFQRSAWFGGLIFYWTKTALRARLYREGVVLLSAGWWMILFAIVRRSGAWLIGRRPVETLPLI